MGGSFRAAFTAITCRGRVKLQIMTMLHESIDRRRAGTLLTSGPSGSMANDQSATSSVLMTLWLTARLALVAAYSRGRRSSSSRDCATATGSVVSSISKMWSRLSMRGTIRRWWRLARTEAAISPASAKAFSAFKAESSRS
jgi:hypothetical protein